MIRTLTLISILFFSSCSFNYNENQKKHKIITCTIVKKYNNEKNTDSSALLHVSLDKEGDLHKVSFIESTCGKLNKDDCVKFKNNALRTVYINTNIKNLLIDQHEDWKELNLLFKPSLIKTEL